MCWQAECSSRHVRDAPSPRASMLMAGRMDACVRMASATATHRWPSRVLTAAPVLARPRTACTSARRNGAGFMGAFGPVQVGVVDGDLAFTRFEAGAGRPGGPCGPCLRASATCVGRGWGGGGGRGSPCGGGCGKGRCGGCGEGRGGHCGGGRGGHCDGDGGDECGNGPDHGGGRCGGCNWDRGGDRGGDCGGDCGGDRGEDRGVSASAARAAEAGREDGDGQRTSTPPSSCHPLHWWWARMCSSKRNCTEKPAEHCCSGHTNRGAASAKASPPGSRGRASHMHSPAAQGAAAQGDYSTRGHPKAEGSREQNKRAENEKGTPKWAADPTQRSQGTKTTKKGGHKKENRQHKAGRRTI